MTVPEQIASGTEGVFMKTLSRLLTGSGRGMDVDDWDTDQLGRAALRHGVHRCLFHKLESQEKYRPFINHLRTLVMNDIAMEIGKERRFIQTLNDADLLSRFSPVFFKGQALAYSLYPHMWMRPRDDIDMLIDERDRESVITAFKDLGYQRASSIDADLVLPQITMHGEQGRINLVWDIHWRLSNRPIFAECLDYNTLAASSITIHVDGHAIHIPDTPHNLLIACLHLIGHHSHQIRLIWLYDIHLLVEKLSEGEREQFLEKAKSQPDVRDACYTALDLTRQYLPADQTDALWQALDSGAGARRRLSRSYLSRLFEDARALNMKQRCIFVKQHLFPSADYMMKRFGIKHRWQLPFWYVIRIGRALPKLFKRR